MSQQYRPRHSKGYDELRERRTRTDYSPRHRDDIVHRLGAHAPVVRELSIRDLMGALNPPAWIREMGRGR